MRWPELGQVGEQGALLIVGEDLRSDRDLDHQVLAAGAGTVRACPALSAGRAEMLGVAEVDQRIEAGHRLEDDVAALSAVAAVGAAELDELLAPEADRAGSAGAGLTKIFAWSRKCIARPTRPSARGGKPVAALCCEQSVLDALDIAAHRLASRWRQRDEEAARVERVGMAPD